MDQVGNATDRLLQVDKILEEFNETKVFSLLCGDFNAEPDSQEMKNLQQLFTDLTKPSDRTYPSEIPYKKIDYCWALNKFKNNYKFISAHVVNETMASDHRPLFVELSLI